MSLPKQYEITEQEMWQLYLADELKAIMTLDHIVLAKKKSDGSQERARPHHGQEHRQEHREAKAAHCGRTLARW